MAEELRPTPTNPRQGEGFRASKIMYFPSIFVVAAGLWLMIAPLLLSGEHTVEVVSTANKTVVGGVLTAIAGIRVAWPATTRPLSLINVLLGGWMIVSPFALGYQTAVELAWNDVIVGMVVMMIAGVSWFAMGRLPPADSAGRGDTSIR